MDLRPVVLLPRHRVAVGQGIGAGDVQVVLQADKFGRLVGLEERVERDVGRDARGALGTREELHQHDLVGASCSSARNKRRLERRNLVVVFFVELSG